MTSAGGREYLLVVASPKPVPEIEADLERLRAPEPGRPIDYARSARPRWSGCAASAASPNCERWIARRRSTPSRAFDRFRALAGRETGVQGVWVRQIVLENPGR